MLGGIFELRFSFRDGVSRLPGACCVDTDGERGRRLLLARIPRADARLLAIEELRSRWGSLRGEFKVGRFRSGDGPRSDLEARSSATAADVDKGFSVVADTSCAGGFSVGNRRISESFW